MRRHDTDRGLLRHPNFEVIGIDLVFEILRRISKVRVPQVPLIAGDIEFLPFRKDSLDIVIHNQVLHFFFQREVILSEIGRVLRPGGLLESIETNGWNPYVCYHHYCKFSDIIQFISKNENPFSLTTYRKELENVGFKVLGWRMIKFDFIKILSPFDKYFVKIPIFDLIFGVSMLVCS